MKYVLLVSVILFCGSCTSVITRSKMSSESRYKENFIFYTGTRLNYEVLTNESDKKLFLRYALGIPDLPLSMIADTILIPLDLVVYTKGKVEESEPKSELEEVKDLCKKILIVLNEKRIKLFTENFVDKEEIQTSLFDVDLKNLSEENRKSLIMILQKFVLSEMKDFSYKRNGRHFIKLEGKIISFRKNNSVWLLSTFTEEI